jgi:hypothetical protein
MHIDGFAWVRICDIPEKRKAQRSGKLWKLNSATSSQEHQVPSLEHLERFNAARTMGVLLPEQGATAGTIQRENDSHPLQFPL